jgi:hypothetical protein
VDLEAEALQDVESALRLGREDLERAVARGRLAFFAALTLFGLVVSSALTFTPLGAALGGAPWVARVAPLAVFGTGGAYAYAIWRRLSKRGALSEKAAAVAFLDPAIIAVSVVALRRLMDPQGVGGPSEPLAARFDIYGWRRS